MAMRWLTREWQSGALPADEHESRWRTYLEHRDNTAIHLPPALHRLAAAGVDGALTLHQAIPDWWALEPGKAFTLAVISGDDTHDVDGVPQRIVLQYGGNLEVSGDAADLDRWLSDPNARLLYDEIEVLPGRRFEQRFLLAPEGELTVRFDNVLLVSAPTTATEREILIGRRAGEHGTKTEAAVPSDAAPAPTAGSAAPTAVPAPDPVEGAPAPVPATNSSAPRRSLRDLLFGWLPGVRGKA
jgi:hypothetical protein